MNGHPESSQIYTLELSEHEVILLIALLTFAEGAAAEINRPLLGAFEDIRGARSRLVQLYIHLVIDRYRTQSPPSSPAPPTKGHEGAVEQ